ncbi:MAG TPA: ABC transporter permease [Devosia sp.]
MTTAVTAPTLLHVRLRIGVVLALLLLLVGFLSVAWTPYPVDQLDPAAQLQGASAAHLLGTDAHGRDVLSLMMKGLLTSFVVAGIATAIGLFAGVPLGAAALAGGVWGQRLILGGSGVFVSLSALGMAILLAAATAPSALNLMVAAGLLGVATLARATCAALAPQRGRDYVAAARLAGLGGWDLVRRHLLPNVMPRLVAAALSFMATAALLEASLSFVGLGIQAPGSSLGLMLREAQPVMTAQALPVLVPGLALLLVALALNLVATGIRHTVEGGRYAA